MTIMAEQLLSKPDDSNKAAYVGVMFQADSGESRFDAAMTVGGIIEHRVFEGTRSDIERFRKELIAQFEANGIEVVEVYPGSKNKAGN